MDVLDRLAAQQKLAGRLVQVKHGGPGPHSTGSPQLAHAVGGRGVPSPKVIGGYDYDAITPRSSAGVKQGKGPNANRREISNALTGWNKISGDRKALAERLDGWTHSETHTANQLRDARKAGEVDFKGGANPVARELFDRIRSQRGEVRERPLPGRVNLDSLTRGDWASAETIARRFNAEAGGGAAHIGHQDVEEMDVDDKVRAALHDAIDNARQRRSDDSAGALGVVSYLKRRANEVDDRPGVGTRIRNDDDRARWGMPPRGAPKRPVSDADPVSNARARGARETRRNRGPSDAIFEGRTERPDDLARSLLGADVNDGHATAARAGLLGQEMPLYLGSTTGRHAEYRATYDRGRAYRERYLDGLRGKLERARVEARERQYEGGPGYDPVELVEIRRDAALDELDLVHAGEQDFVVLKEPSGTEVYLDADLVRAILRREIKSVTPPDDPFERALYGLSVKHLGPGPHPNGTPQLIHAGRAALMPRGRAGYGLTQAAMRLRGDDRKSPMPAGKYPHGDPRNDPEYEAYTKDLDRRLKSIIETKGDTFDQNSIEVDGQRVLKPERVAVHSEIIEGVISDLNDRGVGRNGRAIMMGGLPGAGKSTAIRQQADRLGVELDDNGDPINFAVINPDDMKQALLSYKHADGTPLIETEPGLKRGEMASLVHEESSVLAKALSTRILDEGFDVIFDITLGNAKKSKKKYLEPARRRGYTDFTGVFVDVPPEVSLHSAGIRHKKPDPETGERGYTGRYVPYDLIAHEAKTPPGSDRWSNNRVQYDKMVADGEFDRAIRYNRMANTFHTDLGDDE